MLLKIPANVLPHVRIEVLKIGISWILYNEFDYKTSLYH